MGEHSKVLVILEFTHFCKFYKFTADGDDFRNKHQIEGVKVRVTIWYGVSRHVCPKYVMDV